MRQKGPGRLIKFEILLQLIYKSLLHQDNHDPETHLDRPAGRGERYILLTAITEEHGELKDARKVWKAAKSRKDYHLNMDSANFEKWLKEQLIPAVKKVNGDKPWMLVLDNASYHCTMKQGEVDPTRKSTKKVDLMAYCLRNQIRTSTEHWRHGGDTCDTLRQKILQFQSTRGRPKNTVETLVEAAGGIVVYTPPYHPELQPIEFLWSHVKQHIAANYTNTRTLQELADAIQEAFNRVPLSFIRKDVAHCRKEELRFIERDKLQMPISPSDFPWMYDDLEKRSSADRSALPVLSSPTMELAANRAAYGEETELVQDEEYENEQEEDDDIERIENFDAEEGMLCSSDDEDESGVVEEDDDDSEDESGVGGGDDDFDED